MIKKDWQRNLDKYLTTCELEADEYARMNDAEKEFIQELKRSFARIESKQQKLENKKII